MSPSEDKGAFNTLASKNNAIFQKNDKSTINGGLLLKKQPTSHFLGLQWQTKSDKISRYSLNRAVLQQHSLHHTNKLFK